MSNPCTNTDFNYLKADNSTGSCYVKLNNCHGDFFSIYFDYYEPMSFSSGTASVWKFEYDYKTNSYIQKSPVPSDKGYMIAYFITDYNPSFITLCHSSTPHIAECTLSAKSYETSFFSSTGIF